MRTVLKFLLLLPLLVLPTRARAPHTIADISGDGMVHQISTVKILASQILIQAAPGNSASTCGSAGGIAGCPRSGDANISTSRGTYFLPGSAQYLPQTTVNNGNISVIDPMWDLAKTYYLVQSGDTVTITWFD